MNNLPYSNPLPPRSATPSISDPPTIQIVEPSRSDVRISTSRAREPKSKTTSLTLDDALTRQIQAFADMQGLASINEAIKLLLRTALGSDPVLAAVGAAWQRALWQERIRLFEALNNWFNEQRQLLGVMIQEAALYTPQNPIHIPPGEQPPTF